MSQSVKNRTFAFLAGCALVMLGFVAGTTVYSGLAQTEIAQLEVAAQTMPLNELEQTMANVYNNVSNSVVAISVESGFEAGEGTGFVIDQQGHIVTNYHVVQGAQEIIVNFLDGTIVRADVVGLDPDSDLAVIRVDDVPVERLIPTTFGDSDSLVIGQQVLAIGSPFSQRWTMTAGIISALERIIDGLSAQRFSIGGVIQTDAPINPGNSGGPLLNLQGQVIGVNSQIRSEVRANAGVGFAIPSNLVARVAGELISRGRVDYSYIGIEGRSISIDVIEALGLANNQRGVLVSDVRPGSPAAVAGLQTIRQLQNGSVDVGSADIITAINGEPLNGMDTLIAYLAANTRPGDMVSLTILRGGEQVKVDLTLTGRPGTTG
jgi:2-alkenal reductase